MKRRIIAMLLVLVLVLPMTAVVSADETAGLVMEASYGESGVDVAVSLQGCAGVSNGRFLVSYDAEALNLVDVLASDAYAVNSVNTESAGTVALAWVGSSLPAEKTLMLTLRFQMNSQNTEDVTITGEGDGIYAGAELVEIAPGSVTVLAGSGEGVDKSALEEAIAKAEKLDGKKYMGESFAAVEKALAEAKAVLADENASQEQVDAAAKALNDAMAALKLAGGSSSDTGDGTQVGLLALLALASVLGMAVMLNEKRRNAV